MFIQFSILTFCGVQPGDPCPGSCSQPNLDITKVNRTGFNSGQWADAAAAAKMKYVLTARHHDGVALWPSAASKFNVGHMIRGMWMS